MSAKIDAVLDFYQKLLHDVGVFDKDGEGMCSYMHNDEPRPVTIAKKRLVFPTKAFCRAGEWEHRIACHPLAEQINQGPSPVLNALKNYILERVKSTAREIAVALMELAADVPRQKALSVKARKYLNSLTEADAKTVKALKQVLDATSDVPEKRFITLMMKNGGKNGALRSTVVSFPFMDDADSEDTSTFFGITMPRKTKDKAMLVSLLEYVLGTTSERETLYGKEAKDGDAPYMHTLLLSFQALADRLNNLIEIHGTSCPNLKPLAFELEWADKLNGFEEFSRVYGVAIPMLPGNSGVENVDESKTKSPYEADAEDLGGGDKANVPWDNKEGDTGYRDSRVDSDRPSRDSREDRSDRNRNDSDRGKSLGDLLGKRRGNDRDRDNGRDGGRDSIYGRSERSGGRDNGRRNW